METDVQKIEDLYDKNFKRNPKEVLAIRKCTMARLCREINVDRASIEANLRRNTRPRFSVMYAISVVLNCSIYDLISEELPDATTLP